MNITLTEDEYHILQQALHGRERQLEDRRDTHPHMLVAIPVLQHISRKAAAAWLKGEDQCQLG